MKEISPLEGNVKLSEIIGLDFMSCKLLHTWLAESHLEFINGDFKVMFIYIYIYMVIKYPSK